MKKKMLCGLLTATMVMTIFAGCGGSGSGSEKIGGGSESGGTAAESGFDAANEITVVSREDGSGTRGAFIELLGIEEEDESGEKVDRTTDEANFTNSTSVMMTTVAGDAYAIGYISLGSMNDSVKGVKIDGEEATVENVKSGKYKVARPFNIATKGEPQNEVAKDFISYIMSAEGQAIVEEEGYISVGAGSAFSGTNPSGKLTVSGSTSVTPVMEKLVEAYEKINTGADITIQTSDSTTGMTDAADGTADIGMASRELKESELDAGLTPTVIAMDGIVVIVNNENPVEALNADQVREIYVGDVTTWDEVQ